MLLVLTTTDNGAPCCIATAVAGEESSGTLSSTLSTLTTDFSTPDSTMAQDGSRQSGNSSGSGKGHAKVAHEQGHVDVEAQFTTAGIAGGPGQGAVNALQALVEADEQSTPINRHDATRMG